MFRLRTVRAKLVALASMSLVVTLAMLPVLGWVMRSQLRTEARDRVRNARKAYVLELDDRVQVLKLAAALIATNSDVIRSIREGDAKGAADTCAAFEKLNPDIDIVFLKKDGSVVARVGCESDAVAERHIVKDALDGKSSEGLSGRGCGATREPSPRVDRADSATPHRRRR